MLPAIPFVSQISNKHWKILDVDGKIIKADTFSRLKRQARRKQVDYFSVFEKKIMMKINYKRFYNYNAFKSAIIHVYCKGLSRFKGHVVKIEIKMDIRKKIGRIYIQNMFKSFLFVFSLSVPFNCLTIYNFSIAF